MQHRGELALHGGELLLGGADLVAAARFGDDARRIFRIGAERDHVGGDAPHRPHQQVMQREEHQHRGDAGDHQRQQQDVDREGPHRVAQRRFVENDFEELAAHRRRPDHPHDVAGLAEQQRVEGIHDGAPPRHAAHVDVLLDLATAHRRRRAGGAGCPSSSPRRGRRCFSGSASPGFPAPCRSARRRAPARRCARQPGDR